MKENITYTIDQFYSKEGIASLNREPFSVLQLVGCCAPYLKINKCIL